MLSTFTVVLATDNGGPGGQMVTATSGDLRYCIEQADAAHTAKQDTIVFSSTAFATPQTITLNSTSGTLVLSDSNPLDIKGPGGGTVTVSGGDQVGVFDVASGTVTMSHLTITHGNNPNGNGGGVFNQGTLTLTNCTLDHDSASGRDGGGGIYNTAALTLTNCILDDDSASGVGGGGGIFNTGTATLTNCTLDDDSASATDGGGIFNTGTATLTNCTLSNNSAFSGGGIYNQGTLTLTNCTLSNDSATQHDGSGGGIYNVAGAGGSLTLINCTLSNDSAFEAGGVWTADLTTLTNCTLSNDSAVYAGGFFINSGTTTLTNCTLSNDSAGNAGGGIFSLGGGAALTLTNCTLSNNSAGYGGGIYVDNGSTLNLTNTIVAGNTATSSGPDISGAVTTADHDLIGNNSGITSFPTGSGSLVGTSSNPIDPRLGPLQNNGGPTQTLALLPGSPAIGQADNAQAPATDERGVKRIDKKGEITDIGAFEL